MAVSVPANVSCFTVARLGRFAPGLVFLHHGVKPYEDTCSNHGFNHPNTIEVNFTQIACEGQNEQVSESNHARRSTVHYLHSNVDNDCVQTDYYFHCQPTVSYAQYLQLIPIASDSPYLQIVADDQYLQVVADDEYLQAVADESISG